MPRNDASAADDSVLLDIHEAARFLRVSEVSVRRYTNSGALSCLRVGGRRQRRFRRADLETFLGTAVTAAQAQPADRPAPRPRAAPPPAATPAAAARGYGNILLEGMEIRYGSHLCQLYGSDRGRTQMATPFLADGIADGDACFLIASEPARSRLLAALRRARGDLDEDIDGGRLRLLEGARSGDAMIELLDQAFSEALEDGYGSLRLLGDMAWFLDSGLSGEELVNFETRYDRLLGHSYPIVSLCLYDARRFSGVDILHALKSHSDTFELPLSRFLLR
jgi:transcriptional repressor of dcmA and dcmR